jgi:hypothetical protein
MCVLLRLVARGGRHLLVAAALTTLIPADVLGQSGVTEIWRDAAGNWSGKRHALDPAGNLLVVGDTVVGDIIQVRKYTPAGQLVWSRIYDPPERVVSYWIASDPGGNAWVAAARITGSSRSSVGFLVLKYDAQGNLLFVDVANGAATRVVTDSAGNAYVTGTGWITGAADVFMVAKYAPDGRRLWTAFLESGSTTFLGSPRSVALSPDETRLAVTGGGFSTTWHALSVALYDTASGRRLWNYLDTTRYGGNDVAFSPDGASVYVGNTEIALTNTMALHRFDLAGNRLFRRFYAQGITLSRLAVDGAGNVAAVGTAAPLPGSGYVDWMTIKTDATGALLWARRYDATTTNNEVPEWVTVDDANAVYVAGMGGPSPTTGVVSFLKPVTLKYDAAGTPAWTTVAGGNAQVTVDGERVFTLETGQMTSVRFDQAGGSGPAPPGAPSSLTAVLSAGAVRLSWVDNATDETQFLIERCAGTGCSAFAQVGAAGANVAGYVDNGVTEGQSYSYRVRASSGTAFSNYSNVATVVLPASLPTAPAALAAASNARRRITLTWTNTAASATSITVTRCTGATCTGFATVAQLGGSAYTWTDTGLRSGTTYRYRVFASDSAGSSPPSNIASATAR